MPPRPAPLGYSPFTPPPHPEPSAAAPSITEVPGAPPDSFPDDGRADVFRGEPHVVGQDGVPDYAAVERNLGDPPSSYANPPPTPTTSVAPSATDTGQHPSLSSSATSGESVSALSWLAIAAGICLVAGALAWRLCKIRSRYHAFPSSSKPPLTASYMLRSCLVPSRGIRFPLPFGLAGGRFEVKPAPTPPPLTVSRTPTVSDDEDEGGGASTGGDRLGRDSYRLAILLGAGSGGNRGAARHSAPTLSGEETEQERRGRERRRRLRRGTSGPQIDAEGRRLGRRGDDDNVDVEYGPRVDAELPPYKGADPALPVYADSIPITIPEVVHIPPNVNFTGEGRLLQSTVVRRPSATSLRSSASRRPPSRALSARAELPFPPPRSSSQCFAHELARSSNPSSQEASPSPADDAGLAEAEPPDEPQRSQEAHLLKRTSFSAGAEVCPSSFSQGSRGRENDVATYEASTRRDRPE